MNEVCAVNINHTHCVLCETACLQMNSFVATRQHQFIRGHGNTVGSRNPSELKKLSGVVKNRKLFLTYTAH